MSRRCDTHDFVCTSIIACLAVEILCLCCLMCSLISFVFIYAYAMLCTYMLYHALCSVFFVSSILLLRVSISFGESARAVRSVRWSRKFNVPPSQQCHRARRSGAEQCRRSLSRAGRTETVVCFLITGKIVDPLKENCGQGTQQVDETEKFKPTSFLCWFQHLIAVVITFTKKCCTSCQ